MSYRFCIRQLDKVDCSNLCKSSPSVVANVFSTSSLKNVAFAVTFGRFCIQKHSSHRASFPFLSGFAVVDATAVHRQALHNPHQMCRYLCNIWCSADTRQLYIVGSSNRNTLCAVVCFCFATLCDFATLCEEIHVWPCLFYIHGIDAVHYHGRWYIPIVALLQNCSGTTSTGFVEVAI